MGKHDNAFRRLMEEPGIAQTFLRELLPAELGSRIAGPPVFEPVRFVSDVFELSEADFVMKVPLDDTELHVYFVLEHKAQPDRWVSVQLGGYMMETYGRLMKQRPARLPAVLGIIVYTGTENWSGPPELHSLIDIPPGMEPFVIGFKFLLVNLRTIPAADIAKDRRLKTGLMPFKLAATPPAEMAPVVSEWLRTSRGDDSLRRFGFHYLSTTLKEEARPLFNELVQEYKRNEEPDMRTIGDYYEEKMEKKLQQKLQEQLQAGMAQFETELRAQMEARLQAQVQAQLQVQVQAQVQAEAQQRRDYVRKLVSSRFNRVPGEFEAVLSAADGALLDELFDRALAASSADDLVSSLKN